MRQAVEAARVETGDVGPAAGDQVNGVLVAQPSDLLRAQSGIGKHPALRADMGEALGQAVRRQASTRPMRRLAMRERMLSTSSCQSPFNSLSPRIAATTSAPCAGGVDQRLRARKASWLRRSVSFSAFCAQTISAPTRSRYRPKFFEQELVTSTSGSSPANRRTAQASSSRPSPKPW